MGHMGARHPHAVLDGAALQVGAHQVSDRDRHVEHPGPVHHEIVELGNGAVAGQAYTTAGAPVPRRTTGARRSRTRWGDARLQ